MSLPWCSGVLGSCRLRPGCRSNTKHGFSRPFIYSMTPFAPTTFADASKEWLCEVPSMSRHMSKSLARKQVLRTESSWSHIVLTSPTLLISIPGPVGPLSRVDWFSMRHRSYMAYSGRCPAPIHARPWPGGSPITVVLQSSATAICNTTGEILRSLLVAHSHCDHGPIKRPDPIGTSLTMRWNKAEQMTHPVAHYKNQQHEAQKAWGHPDI